MQQRYVSIWFRSISTDWMIRRQPALAHMPFVLAAPDHGRMMVTAANEPAQLAGIFSGMSVADSRVLVTSLEVLEDKPGIVEKALIGLAGWCIRFSPFTAVDLPDGLIINATGCAHLWNGEAAYLTAIQQRLHQLGYHVKTAMADTIGAAWALARFGKDGHIIASYEQHIAIRPLPPAALRLETAIVDRLEKLGLRTVSDFINMPRTTLHRRFGKALLQRIDQALGDAYETIDPIIPPEPYQERLPCLEPIVTATGIELALKQLLSAMCGRLQKEEKGLRSAVLKGYRIDGRIEQIDIGTNRPSCSSQHLFKLFELKIERIEPGLGIELFTLGAFQIDNLSPAQNKLWHDGNGFDNTQLAELLDRILGKVGNSLIHRFVPAEHYWPERSFKAADELDEKALTDWKLDRPRPLQLLSQPELISVMAPVPDYPPMNFRYKGQLHIIAKADGPERIEQEWWLQEGRHRDYYIVEDNAGCRYWLFRSGHYDAAKTYQWYLHGFFA